ncbi:hypothetical protein ElyMa_005130900 [Elysia marginata]|uniref:Uncharacterized protein n=1 Tax=Elysia marginata TaxID=1093978 RepID=A0AAV4JKS7_9GAST|nr:hypothetical protein ElyMa_005130900 [Elysia marginata]
MSSRFFNICETWTLTKAVKDKTKSFEILCYRRNLENILEKAQDQRRGITSGGCNRKTARPAGGGSSGHLLQLALGGRIQGRRGLTTSGNGPTIVHNIKTSNGKLRVERNGESWLPTFGPKLRLFGPKKAINQGF